MNQFDDYRPSPAWFRHNPYGIHGIGHAGRVFVWANLIGKRLGSKESDRISPEVARWAAVLHDVGRISDGIDRGHGDRSAEWILRHRKFLPVSLDDELFDRLLYCCRMHEVSDEKIGVLSEELKCIKDADGLDRVRIDDLDPAFLRTEFARSLVEPAWTLYGLSKSAEEPWNDIRRSAEGRGWWP